MDTVDQIALRKCRDRWRISAAVCALFLASAVFGVFFPVVILVIPSSLAGWFLWRVWKAGRNARITVGSLVFILAAGLVIVEMRTRAQSARIEALRATTEANLGARLSLGDDSEKIEGVLRESRIPFTYSEVFHGYYASIATGAPDCRIDVTISTTSSKQLLKISVRTFFISS